MTGDNRRRWLLACGAALMQVWATTLWHAVAPADPVFETIAASGIVVTHGLRDVSAPLRDLDPRLASANSPKRRTGGLSKGNRSSLTPVLPAAVPDGGAAEQTTAGPRAALAPVASFNSGLNSALDNNIAVGPNNLVAMINSRFQVMTKTGTVTFGPVNNNSVFSGFANNVCTNSGDGHIQYDQLAGRWLYTVPNFSSGYWICYAVSTTDDPTGPYYRYAFARPLFPDYPRVAVWPDGYYTTTSTGDTVIQKSACVVDRAKMLAGLAATQQCFTVNNVSFMEPANVDGQMPPTPGAPELIFAAGGAQLNGVLQDDGLYVYRFHVDWNTPANSTLTGPTKINVSPYAFLCGGQLVSCVPQPGSTTRLDAQGDKIMHRAAYRNVGGVESIVLQHSVNTQIGGGGPRWYELRLDANGNPQLYQQSTYAPDARYRWMGSIGTDRKGDIAIGFSYGGGPYTLPMTTSSCQLPGCDRVGVRFTARQVGDPLNVMTYADGIIASSAAAATGTSNRWEDWSVLAIDPTDDCTFWYNGGYMPSGTTSYRGRIGAWRLPNCRLDATGAASTTASTGQYDGLVATFTDSDLTAAAGVFTANINWGDGASSAGVVGGGAGSFSVSGAHTFAGGGVRTITVTITGSEGSTATATSDIDVSVDQTPVAITVVPLNGSAAVGGTQLFTATARNQFGSPVSPQPAFTWDVNGGGSISATGLFTATAIGGPFTVTATSGALVGTAGITVTPAAPPPPVLAYIQGSNITSDTSATTIAKAFTSMVSAGNLIVATMSWGSNAAVSCADSLGNTYVVATTQFDSANNQSLAICYAANAKAGTTTVTATFSSASGFRRLLVHEYSGIALATPVDVVAKNVAGGSTAANAITSTPAVPTASGDLVFGAVMDDDGVTSITAGTGFTQRQSVNNKDLASEDLIQASAGSIAATQTFGAAHRYLAQMVAFKTVPTGPPNAAPTVATAAAASTNPVTGLTTSLSALGADDGGEPNLTYTWATTGTPPAAVTFSANGTNAAKNTSATFAKAGSYTLQVTIRDAGNLTVTSNVAVTVNQTITTIAVAPSTASVPVNGTQQFSATARDQFAALLSPQPAFGWSVDTGGTIDAAGLFTAGAAPGGPFTVTATVGTVSGSATVNVTPVNFAPTIATAAAASPNPVTGTTTSLSALGADDGGEASLTYTWATTGTPPAAVTFSANGTNAAKNTIATFSKAGSYTFQVTIRDAGNLTVTSSVGVTVNQTITTIAVAPSSASVAVSGTQAFSATARDQFAALLSPQPSFTWGVSGGGTINASGTFTAGSAAGGPFSVTASSGDQTGAANVTVTSAAAMGFVQGSTATTDAAATSIAKAFTSPNTAGNLIVAAISWGTNASVSCSDTLGNTYVVATTQFDSTNSQSLAICYAANAKAGANTVTATFSTSSAYRRLLIHEYSGVALVNPVDVVAKNLANGSTSANAITSTAAVTTATGDLIFGAVMDDAGVTSVTAGTGFTQRVSVNNKDLVSEDLVQTVAGSIAATHTFGAAHRYLAQMVAFRKQ